MPLREDLLNPIPGENPSGENLRYQPVYDKIKEARREEEAVTEGAVQRPAKVPNWPQVLDLCQEQIATKSKDLQLAVWLTEALTKSSGFAGMLEGLTLCRGLLENFWETLYPEIEDGDLEMRAAPLRWIGDKAEFLLKSAPVVKEPYKYNWYQWQSSRGVSYADRDLDEAQRKSREETLKKEGKLAPEVFDRAFDATKKDFYAQVEKDLDNILGTVRVIDQISTEKFGEDSPSFSRFKKSLEEEVGPAMHNLLEKKREKEPDPIPIAGPVGLGAEGGVSQAGILAPDDSAYAPALGVVQITLRGTSEPPDRQQAVASIAAAAAFLRQRDPQSPAPYLMIRGLRWGELRAAAHLSDPTLLEGPPTELRQQIKRLALGGNWQELLEMAENAMALPCSRAWLDLQRFVVEACESLGSNYKAIRTAICSELRALLLDLPELLDATLLDDTPAANPETKAWLLTLVASAATAAKAFRGVVNGSIGGSGSRLDQRRRHLVRRMAAKGRR